MCHILFLLNTGIEVQVCGCSVPALFEMKVKDIRIRLYITECMFFFFSPKTNSRTVASQAISPLLRVLPATSELDEVEKLTEKTAKRVFSPRYQEHVT